jgi:hypothetical protein
MLARLIYVSEAAAALNPDDVERILQRARQKNRLHDVSGMLLFDSKAFLQVIEGDALALSDLYGRLTQDSRHTRLKILEFTEVPQRLFGDWAMGFAGAGSENRPVFLRHSSSSQFKPYELGAAGALAVLVALGRTTAAASQVAAASTAN